MGILLTADGGGSLALETFLGYADSVSGWFFGLCGEAITFLIANPALLIWPVVSLFGAGLIYFKKFL